MNSHRLETDRLLLRGIEPHDRAALFRNYSDPEIANWFFNQPYTKIEQAGQIIAEFIQKAEEGAGFTWAILLKETGEFIGTCGYEEFEAGSRGEIGFDLAREHWGKGLMAEALSAIIAYGFEVLKLVQIEAHTYSHNTRARGVLEKLGFKIGSIDEDSHYYTLSQTDPAGTKQSHGY